ncbi:MAG: hypothetical protein ACR2GW_02675 [Pyrinomonadaceae bacterium]
MATLLHEYSLNCLSQSGVHHTPYDLAGRLKGMTGNLGDGVGRTYATNLTYDASK